MIDNDTPPEPGAKKDRNGVWRNKLGHPYKGQSLNPKGRKQTETSKKFRELAQKKSISVLNMVYEIAMDPYAKHQDRLRAGEIILDRAFGKAPQQMIDEEGSTYVPQPILIGNLTQYDQDDEDIINDGE